MSGNLIRQIGIFIVSLGFDPRRLVSSLRFVPTFLRDARAMQRQAPNVSRQFALRWLPVLADRHLQSGIAKGHYFHQDLWAARHVHRHNPREHVDVGSRVDGFIAHLLAFRNVKVLDIRPMASKIPGLQFEEADMMSERGASISADSVSCLHALEHFGLGRYGDPLDLDGWRKGLRNLCRMTEVGGHLYIGVPIGKTQRIEFNAQRVFAPQTMVDEAALHGMQLVEFSYVDDAGDFHERVTIEEAACDFGCGCYLLKKSTDAA